MNDFVFAGLSLWGYVALVVGWLIRAILTYEVAERTWGGVRENPAHALICFAAWPLVLLAVIGTVAGRAFARWLS